MTAGTVVAGYRIERVLGSGSVGTVYAAAHPTLPRWDAVKIISADLSQDADFRARFLHDANAAAALTHPQIVPVYGLGQTDDGRLWIASQFVDGTDAEAALRAGAMTPQRAVHIIGQVAQALDFAHAHHVVHRNLKPANFLLSAGGGPHESVLLGDFGIGLALHDVGMMEAEPVMATVAYAAPETLSGQAFDGRADVYSLGCTLFRLLTGKTPFPAGKGPAAVLMAHLQSPPPRITDLVDALPAALDDVIATALAKDPAARFGSASALADAAAAALQQGAPPAPVPSQEVSPYLRSPTPAAPQHGGPEVVVTYGTPELAGGAPARGARRRRGALIGGAVGAAVLLAATITVVVAWPRGGPSPATPASSTAAQRPPAAQGPPATDVAASALRSILLSASEIPGNTGDSAMVLEQDGTELGDDAAMIDNPACLSAWAPAQRSTYATPSPAGVAVQELRALYQKPWQRGVTQAVLAFGSVDDAGLALQLQRAAWEPCGGQTATITPPGEPAQQWRFGQPVNKAGSYTVEATLTGGDATCQHGIELQGNVLIDIRQCGTTGAIDVSALVNATANKVPRQQ
ncbi:serine/threonine protein kinase [Mycobacterium talmoniae]|uniref:non-specific serine/threonine protein kinase n=1 Tax=Mycobacterium talmoniae TaxID=1858794 RepID=A0A1S1NLA6_9MYCO|nr:serine/threonine protein kinase [Mycobacterium talmoniae]